MLSKNLHKHPGSDTVHVTSDCPHPHFTAHGRQYTVVDRKTGAVLSPHDPVTDFRGCADTIEYISRGPEYNGTAKVIISGGREYYDHVFDLDVVPAS